MSNAPKSAAMPSAPPAKQPHMPGKKDDHGGHAPAKKETVPAHPAQKPGGDHGERKAPKH